MFKKSNAPQKRTLSLTTDQIKEDIEAVWPHDEQRNMLYYCLDEKPPVEYKLSKMEEFLTGSNNLESVQESLKDLVKEVEKLTNEISDNLTGIKKKIEDHKSRTDTP
ncbi:unnamed protein product [Phyllotreta striolata]|uniref:Uncharacterized protein n=1 Tax=Phyllotreta striolata TaxID=444603 RepID=A0A9N9TFQ3_PHYSR|nr:unnamed protein product [Phyllotreta striolata]